MPQPAILHCTNADNAGTRDARIAAGDVDFLRAELVRLQDELDVCTEQRDKARRDAAQFARDAQRPPCAHVSCNPIAIQRRLATVAHALYGRDGARLFVTEAECDELGLR